MATTDKKINKTDKILCIVESPNKKATISSIFKNAGFTNVTVMASVGHITEIKDDKKSYWNTGIYPNANFKINFTVAQGKKEVVSKLKEAVKKADLVILATDPDREGECISWHLKDQLKIPNSKYQRITFHEITKPAILAALDAPRKIDDTLVDAAKARSVIDKMIGFRLSPIARNNIGTKSVGRCQSAGLKLIVDREMEIKNFVPEKYFDLYLHFKKNNQSFKAKYWGSNGKAVKRITKLEDCNKIIESCKGHDFIVDSVEQKDLKEYPKPPFTTSTFQQEANKVYGMSIDAAMSCAQKLFEGINLMGEHIGLITYIRTDDDTMSPDFMETLKKYVIARYSKNYLGSIKSAPKSDTAQGGHECLRVVDPEMTPEKLKDYITDTGLLKIYRLIWNRTVSSLMAPAIISDTQYNIANNNNLFVMHSKEIKFDGYRAIYSDPEDAIAEDEVVKETFKKGEVLLEPDLKAEEKSTLPPKRYSQATFIKELEKQGIGRPSTFATIVKTILSDDRGYCSVDNKLLVPTEKGIALSKFLDDNFNNVISIKYTNEMEKGLDAIAKGETTYLSFLNQFYNNLEQSVKDSKATISESTSSFQEICPICGSPMKVRKGPYGTFWGCTNYPNCKGIKPINRNYSSSTTSTTATAKKE